ncbi:hypothetical protein COU54_03945 [Candidatus Pacearchaeota archaeon CG10_big_fil_rev_8_21_14_0_10_31_24]|nr:MAG: hypothetical protein COU54_03945 [Candidatus Pacearchaeota archaeon CG10_big_fil_rev_8_21_14_0_10_31_24]
MVKKSVLIGLFLILLAIGIGYFYNSKPLVNDELGDYCEVDSDCVPNNCCHADSCVSVDNAPECEGVRCTLSCEPGTLDCGQGSCGCVNNRCSASIKENR